MSLWRGTALGAQAPKAGQHVALHRESMEAWSLVDQSYPTLCDPVDCSLPGLSPWNSQARILEWVSMPSSRGSSPPRDRTCNSCISCIGRRVLYGWSTWDNLPWLYMCVLSFYSFLVFCFPRRHLSRCKLCSKVFQVQACLTPSCRRERGR